MNNFSSFHGFYTRTQDQSDVLITRFGVVPEVKVLIRHIWFSLLPHTGYLDFDSSAERWVRA